MLDLSKLKALEFPKKEVEVEIMGELQKVEVSAFGDDIYLELADIKDSNPTNCEYLSRKILLNKCAGLSEDDAKILLSKDGRAATKILTEIFEITDAFDAERKKIRENAKKKSGQSDSVNMKG